LITCATDEDEARTVADNILDLHHRSATPYNDFAVLYRTNAQSRVFEELFRYENIPYVLIGGQQFFDRKEVKDALAYLQVIANPHDEVNLLRILNYPKRGIGETSAELLIQASAQRRTPLWDLLREPTGLDALGEKPLAAIGQFTSLLEKYRLLFSRTRQLTAASREFFREIGLEDEIWRTSEGTEQGKRRLEHLGEVFNALAAYEAREALPNLDDFLEKVSLLDYEEPGRGDKETKLGRDAVVLMSLHSSKGLEFPHVFLAGMEEDCLPHRTSEGESADIEEERRLLYVGITRARKTLTLLHVRHRKKYGKPLARMPSRFLSELPDELLQRSTSQPPASAEDQKKRGASFFAEIKAKLDL
jgi:superfamily I DNA/RNA helicase